MIIANRFNLVMDKIHKKLYSVKKVTDNNMQIILTIFTAISRNLNFQTFVRKFVLSFCLKKQPSSPPKKTKTKNPKH